MRIPEDDTGRLTRRGLIGTGLAATFLAGCGAKTGGRSVSTAGAGATGAALLLPLTGAAAAVGQNMARAAEMAMAGGASLPAFDTGDTPEGAAAAAKAALEGGAKLLLGPLRSDQTPAVLAAAGRVPVVAFSNDDRLAAQGAFVMGITPAQSVATMFSYARAQGLTRVALVAADTPLGEASAAAAGAIGAAGGIEVAAVLLRDPGQGGLADALRREAGAMPQAVFLPDGGRALAGFAKGLAGTGMQIMGSVQWGAADPAADANLSGAWFAAPPPDLFQPFADRFAAAHGEAPGVVAGLGHDAAMLAAGLAGARVLSRKGLVRKGGFTGVLGPFRFLDDGRCLRDLAVLTLAGGEVSVLAEVSGT